jgi:hypothetical protein
VQIQQSPIAETVDDDAGVDNDNFITPPHNNVHQQRNMTINNDLVSGVEDGADNAGEATANVEVRRLTPPTIYKSTDKSDWTMLKPNEQGEVVRGWHVAPIPYTGGNNEFTVNMTDMEKSVMKDANGNMRFHKKIDWLLPTIGMQDVPFYKFVLARMQNYMIHIINNEGYKPRFYNPQGGITISADHVARFFLCQLCRGRKKMPSIVDCWSTQESLDAIGTVKEAMPLGSFMDMYHFADDMVEEEGEIWEDSYVDVKHELPRCARHW